MKTTKQILQLVCAGALALAVAGCTKTHVDPPPAIAALNIINASPDAPGVTFYADQNRINYDVFAYTQQTQYLNAIAGTRVISAYEGQTNKLSDTVALKPGRFYSLFLSGQWQTPEFVLLEDSLARPDAGQARVRFVNMSVGSPALDLGFADSTVVSNRTYKQNSGFVSIKANKSYQFVIREHGSAQAKVTLPAQTLGEGRIYTVWARGIYSQPGDNGVGGGIILNY